MKLIRSVEVIAIEMILLAVLLCAGCGRGATNGTDAVDSSGSDDDATQLKQEAIAAKKALFDKVKNHGEFKRREIEEVPKLLERALAKNPTDMDLLREAADFHFQTRQYPQVKKYCETLMALSEEGKELTTEDRLLYARSCCLMGGPNSEKGIAALYGMLGYDPSTESFDADKATDPSSVDVYLLLAQQAALNSRDEMVRASLDQMVTANSANVTALLSRAKFIRGFPKFGTVDDAAADLHTALKLDPENPAANLAMADLALEQQKIKDAKKYARIGLDHVEAAPMRSALTRVLAKVHVAARENEQAIAVLDKELNQHPKEGELGSLKARILLDACEDGNDPRIGEVEKLLPALKSSSRPGLVPYLEARILMLRGEQEKAEKVLERIRPMLSKDLLKEVDALLQKK